MPPGSLELVCSGLRCLSLLLCFLRFCLMVYASWERDILYSFDALRSRAFISYGPQPTNCSWMNADISSGELSWSIKTIKGLE